MLSHAILFKSEMKVNTLVSNIIYDVQGRLMFFSVWSLGKYTIYYSRSWQTKKSRVETTKKVISCE